LAKQSTQSAFSSGGTFIHNTNAAEITSGSTFHQRLDTNLQGIILLEKKKKQAIKAILSDEIMFNAGKSTVKRS
jgi:hypothetical protein